MPDLIISFLNELGKINGEILARLGFIMMIFELIYD
jgi:hypothetical protein